MRLLAPMVDVRNWLQALQERGYATVLEVVRAEECDEPRTTGLIDPLNINVFEEGGYDFARLLDQKNREWVNLPLPMVLQKQGGAE